MVTRNYEIAFIFSPNLDDSALDQEIDGVRGLVERDGGTVGEIDKWTKRRLAYAVKGENNGYYAFVKASGEPQAIRGLESSFRLNENILRHIIICEDD